jgi:hypothetical protein
MIVSDFVSVQLSPAGVAFAGAGGQVRVANGHFTYTFTAAAPVRVLSSEWTRLLSLKKVGAEPMLQVVAAAMVAKPASPAAKAAVSAPAPVRVDSPADAHTDSTQPVLGSNQSEPQVKAPAPAPNEVK